MSQNPQYLKIQGFKLVLKEKCELEGPYECISCGGHIMFDGTYLDQVSEELICPYCTFEKRTETVTILTVEKQ